MRALISMNEDSLSSDLLTFTFEAW